MKKPRQIISISDLMDGHFVGLNEGIPIIKKNWPWENLKLFILIHVRPP
jgi:hypothetical protein